MNAKTVPFHVPLAAYLSLEKAVELYGYGRESLLAMVKHGAIDIYRHNEDLMFKTAEVVDLKLDIIKRSNEVVR